MEHLQGVAEKEGFSGSEIHCRTINHSEMNRRKESQPRDKGCEVHSKHLASTKPHATQASLVQHAAVSHGSFCSKTAGRPLDSPFKDTAWSR